MWEEIYEFFVGTNTTVLNKQVSVKWGSNEIFIEYDITGVMKNSNWESHQLAIYQHGQGGHN